MNGYWSRSVSVNYRENWRLPGQAALPTALSGFKGASVFERFFKNTPEAT